MDMLAALRRQIQPHLMMALQGPQPKLAHCTTSPSTPLSTSEIKTEHGVVSDDEDDEEDEMNDLSDLPLNLVATSMAD